jgi:hypothetical protein
MFFLQISNLRSNPAQPSLSWQQQFRFSTEAGWGCGSIPQPHECGGPQTQLGPRHLYKTVPSGLMSSASNMV